MAKAQRLYKKAVEYYDTILTLIDQKHQQFNLLVQPPFKNTDFKVDQYQLMHAHFYRHQVLKVLLDQIDQGKHVFCFLFLISIFICLIFFLSFKKKIV